MDSEYLIRTVRDNDLDFEPYVGQHKAVDTSAVQDARKNASNELDFDSRIIFPNSAGSIDDYVHNTMPDTAFSAVGYATPQYSLYPLVRANGPFGDKDEVVLDRHWEVPDEALPTFLRGMHKQDIKRVLLRLLKDKAKQYGINLTDLDNLQDAGLTEILAELGYGVRDKMKYRRLLGSLRGYADNTIRKCYAPYTYEYVGDMDMYNRPQIALIRSPINRILTAKDKIMLDSAESDGPAEYRVHDYTIEGVWSPATVDKVLRKYYKGYDGRKGTERISSFLKKYPEERRAKDAIGDIIQAHPDIIVSDRIKKEIISDLSFNDTRMNSSILHGVREVGQ